MTGFYWGPAAHGAPWPACVLFQSEDGTIYAAADTALAAVTWAATYVIETYCTPRMSLLPNAQVTQE